MNNDDIRFYFNLLGISLAIISAYILITIDWRIFLGVFLFVMVHNIDKHKPI